MSFKLKYLWNDIRPIQCIQIVGDPQSRCVQALIQSVLRMVPSTSSAFSCALQSEPGRSTRIVLLYWDGWQVGKGGGFPALWLDSSRWRVLRAGPRWKEGWRWLHGLLEGTWGHAHGSSSFPIRVKGLSVQGYLVLLDHNSLFIDRLQIKGNMCELNWNVVKFALLCLSMVWMKKIWENTT